MSTTVVVTYQGRVVGLHESHSALLTAVRRGRVRYQPGAEVWMQATSKMLSRFVGRVKKEK